MPSEAWRLHHVENAAAAAHVTALKANEVLAAAGVNNRVPTEGYESLQQVADFLRLHEAEPSVRSSKSQ